MKFYASTILLHNGWANDKTITVDNGLITNIESGNHGANHVLDGAVIPGMINAHSHAFQRAFAGLSEYRAERSDSFWSWRRTMYQLISYITPDALYLIARHLYEKMLENGYTSCAEFHYLHHQVDGVHYEDKTVMSKALIEAAKDAGIYLQLMPVFYHYSDFNKQPVNAHQKAFYCELDEFKSMVTELESQFSEYDNLSFAIAPHSLRAVSDEQLHHLCGWWQEKPIHIHVSEQLNEVEACIAAYGARPVEWLCNNFSLTKRWALVHATHLTDNEIATLAETSAVPVLCPHTEANLGDGVFPAERWLGLNGRFAIGSDSHICMSPFEELKLLEYGQRLMHQKRNILCTPSSPHVATFLWEQSSEAGRSIVNEKSGTLAIGQRADFVVINGFDTCSSVHSMYDLDYAVFAANQNPVRDVWVAGERKVSNASYCGSTISNEYLDWIKALVTRL